MKKAILVLALGLAPHIVQANADGVESCEVAPCDARPNSSLQEAHQMPLRTSEHEKVMQKIDTLMDKAFHIGINLGAIVGGVGGICVGCLVTLAGFWCVQQRHQP